MARHFRNALIAFFVSAAVAFLISLSLTGAGVKPGLEIDLIGAGCGMFTFFILWNLSGNRKVATADKASREMALAMQPPAGHALLYLVRKGFVAKAAGMDLSLDGALRAHLKSPQFTCLTLAPATYELGAAFGGGAGAQSQPHAETIVLQAGQILGIAMIPKFGAVRGSIVFNELDRTDLARLIKRTKMMAPV